SDQQYATVSGGFANTSSGTYAAIPGGFFNVAAGRSSFAAGRKAKANHDGSFVFGDSSDFNVNSFGSDTFTVRSVGGARFISAIDGSGNATAGVSLPAGGTAWGILSDRNQKKNFHAIEG